LGNDRNGGKTGSSRLQTSAAALRQKQSLGMSAVTEKLRHIPVQLDEIIVNAP